MGWLATSVEKATPNCGGGRSHELFWIRNLIPSNSLKNLRGSRSPKPTLVETRKKWKHTEPRQPQERPPLSRTTWFSCSSSAPLPIPSSCGKFQNDKILRGCLANTHTLPQVWKRSTVHVRAFHFLIQKSISLHVWNFFAIIFHFCPFTHSTHFFPTHSRRVLLSFYRTSYPDASKSFTVKFNKHCSMNSIRGLGSVRAFSKQGLRKYSHICIYIYRDRRDLVTSCWSSIVEFT